MKAKTIVAILSKKHKNFCESIKDEQVKKLVEMNSIITGGSIVSLLKNENVSDFDIYFRNSTTAVAVARYYAEFFKDRYKIEITGPPAFSVRVKSLGIATNEEPEDEESTESPEEQDSTKRYQPLSMTNNAITLANKIQLILRFWGEPEEIHKNFDFVHCTNYWQSWDRRLVLRQEALEAILAMELRYVGSKYPLCSIFRLRKFIKRGWTINAGQILKIAWNLRKFDLSDRKVLEDQLTGVDATFFHQLLDRIEGDGKIDETYLMELIDKIF